MTCRRRWIEFLGFGCGLVLLLFSAVSINRILEDIGKAFVAAAILEVIYGLVMLHKIYLGVARVAGIVLAIIRFLLLRARSTIGRQKERSAMTEEPTHKQSMSPLDTSTRLAYERTYLAHERTPDGVGANGYSTHLVWVHHREGF